VKIGRVGGANRFGFANILQLLLPTKERRRWGLKKDSGKPKKKLT